MKPKRHKGQQQNNNNNNNNIGLEPRVQNSFAVEIATHRKPSARLDRNWSRFLYVLGALDFLEHLIHHPFLGCHGPFTTG